jgi:hypothetical protein
MTFREFRQLPIQEQLKIVEQKYRREMFALREGLARNDPDAVEQAKINNAAVATFREFAKGKQS